MPKQTPAEIAQCAMLKMAERRARETGMPCGPRDSQVVASIAETALREIIAQEIMSETRGDPREDYITPQGVTASQTIAQGAIDQVESNYSDAASDTLHAANVATLMLALREIIEEEDKRQSQPKTTTSTPGMSQMALPGSWALYSMRRHISSLKKWLEQIDHALELATGPDEFPVYYQAILWVERHIASKIKSVRERLDMLEGDAQYLLKRAKDPDR